jgi:chemotaxis protein MotB
LQGQVGELQRQLADRDGIINNLKQQINQDEQTIITDLKNQVTTRDGKIGDLDKQVGDLSNAIANLTAKNTELQNQVDHFQPFEAQAAELQRQLAVKDSVIADLTKGDAQLKAIIDQDKKLLAKAADQAKQIDVDTSVISDLKGKLATSEGTNKTLQDQNKVIEDRIKQMTADFGQTTKRINDLTTLNSGLNDQVAARLKELSGANAKILDLTKANQALSDNLNALKTGSTKEVADYMAQVGALTKSNADLQNQVGDLQQQLNIQSQKAAKEMQARIDELNKALGAEIAQGNIEIKQYRDVLIISVKDSVLFPPDSPVLLPQNMNVLKALGDVFKKVPDRIVRVEGSTAVALSSPETLRLYPTSWHLAAARAANVVQYLQEKGGVDPHQLVATSLGEYSPKADNLTEAGKAQNRRVDFILMARALWEIDRLNSVQ